MRVIVVLLLGIYRCIWPDLDAFVIITNEKWLIRRR